MSAGEQAGLGDFVGEEDRVEGEREEEPGVAEWRWLNAHRDEHEQLTTVPGMPTVDKRSNRRLQAGSLKRVVSGVDDYIEREDVVTGTFADLMRSRVCRDGPDAYHVGIFSVEWGDGGEMVESLCYVPVPRVRLAAAMVTDGDGDVDDDCESVTVHSGIVVVVEGELGAVAVMTRFVETDSLER